MQGVKKHCLLCCSKGWYAKTVGGINQESTHFWSSSFKIGDANRSTSDYVDKSFQNVYIDFEL